MGFRRMYTNGLHCDNFAVAFSMPCRIYIEYKRLLTKVRPEEANIPFYRNIFYAI